MYNTIHVQDAPALDEEDGANDCVVVNFIDKYINCLLPNESSDPDLFQLVKQVQTHNYTTTSRKKKHTMSKLMKKAAKEVQGQGSMRQLNAIGNVFLTKREVSTHESVKRLLPLHMRVSNVNVDHVSTGLRKTELEF